MRAFSLFDLILLSNSARFIIKGTIKFVQTLKIVISNVGGLAKGPAARSFEYVKTIFKLITTGRQYVHDAKVAFLQDSVNGTSCTDS